MVAIVTGSGLGLFNSSLSVLGGQGGVGNATLGQGNEGLVVNAASGNLVATHQDEFLASQGLDTSLTRTYNSQGLLDDDNADNWRFNVPELRVVDNNPVRVAGDGNESVFTGTLGDWTSTDGSGAHQRITADFVNNEFIWEDDNTGIKEFYRSSDLQLLRREDRNGNVTLYSFNAAGLITEINDASLNQTLTINYDANVTNRVVSLTTTTLDENNTPIVMNRVSYGYDAAGRLSTLTVDLTPDNTTDNQTYVTTYTYHDGLGNNHLINTVSQSDGTTVSFAYVLVGTEYKVSTITDGKGVQTTFDYSVAGQTRVTNNTLNTTTIYSYDSENKLIGLQAPDLVNGQVVKTAFEYDADDNVTAVVDGNGNRVEYRYDNYGNRVYEKNSEGIVVVRQFNDNQIVSETKYQAEEYWTAGFENTSNHWTVYDNDPVGATVTEVYDDILGHNVVELSGAGTTNGYKLWESTAPNTHWNNTEQSVISWNQQFSEGFTVYISVDTTAGHRYLTYNAGTGAPAINTNNTQHLNFTLGNVIDGEWHSFSRDLAADLKLLEPDVEIIDVNGFLIRGSGRVDNIRLSDELPPQPQRYTYDASGRLQYVVTPEGRVSEYLYDTYGNRESEITYLQDVMPQAYANTDHTDVYASSDIDSWVSLFNPDLTQTQRVDTSYNFRGNVSGVRTYGAIGIDGRGDVGTSSTTLFIYNEQGQLLQRIDPRGFETRTIEGDFTTHYIYDGMGRLLSTTNAINQTSTIMYDDAKQRTIATESNGLSTLSVYDANGQLIEQVQGNANYWQQDFATDTSGLYGSGLDDQTLMYWEEGRLVVQTVDTSPVLYENRNVYGSRKYSQEDGLTFRANITTGATSLGRHFVYGATNGQSSTSVNGRAHMAEFSEGSVYAYYIDTASGGYVSVLLGTVTDNSNYIVEVISEAEGTTLYVYEEGAERSSGYSHTLNDTDWNVMRTRIYTKAKFDSIGAKVYVNNLSELGSSEIDFNDAELAQGVSTTLWGQDFSTDTSGLLDVNPTVANVVDGQLELVTQDTRDTTYYKIKGEREYNFSEGVTFSFDITTGASSVDRYLLVGADNTGSTSTNTYRRHSARIVGNELHAYYWDKDKNAAVSDYLMTVADNTSYRVEVVTHARGSTLYVYEAGQAREDGVMHTANETDWGDARTRIQSRGVKKGTPSVMYIDNVEESVTPQTKVQYTYDSEGRLRSVTDPLGNSVHTLYDNASRPVMSVSATGTLSETAYDAAGNVVYQATYANALSTGTLTTLGSNSELDLTTLSLDALRTEARDNSNISKDRITWSHYNSANQLQYQLSADRRFGSYLYYNVTQFNYDGAGQLTDELRYKKQITDVVYGIPDVANSSTWATISDIEAGIADANPTVDKANRLTRNFYDNDGNVIATLDGEGYLVEYVYTNASQLKFSFARANQLTILGIPVEDLTAVQKTELLQLHSTGSLAEIKATIGPDEKDQKTTSYYNARGQLIADVDVDGYLTEYSYDLVGNREVVERYYNAVMNAKSLTGNENVETIRPAINYTQDHRTVSVYDSLNRLDQLTTYQSVFSVGVTTDYTYDEQSRLISTTRGLNTNDVRTTQRQYDLFGRVTKALSGEGSEALNALVTPTQAQIDAVWAQYSVQYTYTRAGQLTSQTDQNGNVSYFYYDDDARLRYTLSVSDKTTQQAEVKELVYNNFGQVKDSISYATRLSISGIASNVLLGGKATQIDSIVKDVTNGIVNNSLDSRNTTNYNLRGAIASILSSETPTGEHLNFAYNAFGEQTASYRILNGDYHFNGVTKDRRGLTIANTRSLNATQLQQTHTQYDAFGRITQSTDANNNITSYLYDQDTSGRLVTTTDTVGSRSITYDAFNRVIFQTDGNEKLTSYTYFEGTGQTQGVGINQSGVASNSVTNVYGELVAQADGFWRSSELDYDANGNVISETDRENNIITHEYDDANRLVKTIDANLIETSFTYDDANRLTHRIVDAVTGGLNLTTEYKYDAKGQRTQVIDPNNVVTETEYDRDGQVKAIVIDKGGLNLRAEYNYDVEGNALTVTEAAGTTEAVTTQYIYDALNRRTHEIVDPYDATTNLEGLNLTTRYVYDDNNNVITTTQGEGTTEASSTRFIYDERNRQTYVIDAEGGISQSVYDAENNIIKTVQYADALDAAELNIIEGMQLDKVDASVIELYLENTVKNSGTQDASLDREQRFVYDGANRLAFSIDGEGGVTYNTLDANGNATKITQYAVALSAAEISALDQTPDMATLLAIVNGAGRDHTDDRISYASYDSNDRVIFTLQAYDINGVSSASIVEHAYDANGNLIARVAFATPVNLTTAVFANADAPSINELRLVTQGGNNDEGSAYIYDNANRLRFSVDAGGYISENTYDAKGQVIQTTAYESGLNYINLFIAAGVNPTGLTQDEMRALLPTVMVESTLNAAITKDPANDQITKLVYDAAGQIRYQIDAENYVTETQYDARGNVEFTTRHYNGITLSASTPTIADVQAALQARNAPTTQKDQTTQFIYDGADRVITQTNALNSIGQSSEHYAYDANGNVIRHQDANGRYEYFAYDTNGNLARSINAEGFVLDQQYNSFAQVENVKTWMNKVITPTATDEPRFAYTSADPLANNSPDSGDRTQSYTYNQNGLLETQTDAYATLTRNQYNTFSNVTDITRAEGLGVEQVSQQTFDKRGQIETQTLVGLNITTEYQYDAKGQRVQVIDPNNAITETEYYADGNVLAIVVDKGGLKLRTEYTYDAQGNVATITEAAGTTDARTTAYTYDRLNRRTHEIVDPSGLNLITRHYYDNNGNVIATTQGEGTSDASTTRYIYDEHNRQSYSIDAEGGVTQSFYDAESNLIAGVRYSDAVDTTQLTTFDEPVVDTAVIALLDPTGTRDTRWDNVQRFVYDATNRLRFSVDAEGSITERIYDAENNVVSSIRYSDAIDTSLLSTLDTQVLEADLQTLLDPTGTRDTSLDRTQRFVYDATNRLSFSIDAEGSVTHDILDANGNATKTTQYAVALNTTELATFDQAPNMATLLNLVNSAGKDHTQDRISYTSYDQNNRVIFALQTYDINGVSLASIIEQAYDANGNVIARVAYAAPIDLTTAVFIDADAPAVNELRPLTQGGNSDQGTAFIYDNANRLRFTVDAGGYITENTYDAKGQLVQTTAYANELNYINLYVAAGVNPVGLTQDEMRALLPTVLVETTLTAAIATTIDPIHDQVTTNVFDSAGQIRYQVDAQGYVTETEYDARGNVVLTTRHNDAITLSISAPTVLDIQEITAPVSVKDQIVQFDYDRSNKIITQTYALNSVEQYNESYAYDAQGNLIRHTDGNGNNEYFGYDNLGQQTRHINQAGYVIDNSYNAFGDIQLETTWMNAASSIATDDDWAQKDNASIGLTANADAISGDRNVAYQYDELGQLLTKNDGQSTTQYIYDAFGNLTDKIEALGLPEENATHYIYDNRNQLIEEQSLEEYTLESTQGVESVSNQYVYENSFHVAYDDNGNAMAVWEQRNSSGVKDAVYARRYIADVGWEATATLLIDAPTFGDTPKVSVDPQGNFLVAWRQGQDIHARHYSAITGWDAQSTLLDSNASTAWYPIDVELDAQGNGQVIWSQTDDVTGEREIYTKRYISGVGFETQAPVILSTGVGNAVNPAISFSENGNAIAVWSQLDGTVNNIYARELINGAWSAEIVLLDTGATAPGKPNITFDDLGNAYALWVQNNSVYARRFTAGVGWGTDAPIQLSTTTALNATPTISIDANGNAIVAFQQLDNDVRSIFTRHYSIDTGWDAAPTSVEQSSLNAITPVVSHDAAGNALLVWEDGDSIHSKRYWFGEGWSEKVVLLENIDATASRANIGFDKNGSALALWLQKTSQTTDFYAARILKAPSIVKRYEYDSFGNQTKVIDARAVELAERNTQWSQTERLRLKYPEFSGELTDSQKTDLLDLYTTYQTFDPLGRQYSAVSPLDSSKFTAYDAFNNIVKVSDGNGGDGYFFYDKLNRLAYEVNPEGYLTQFIYDGFSAVSETIVYNEDVKLNASVAVTESQIITALTGRTAENQAKDQVTRSEHDNLNRTTQITDAENHSETYTYDAMGNVLNFTQKNNTVNSSEYDELGNKISEHRNLQSGFAVDLSSNFSYAGSIASQQEVAFDADGNAVAVWVQNGTVYTSRFIEGEGWGESGSVSSGIGASYSPKIDIDAQGNVIVVWKQFVDGDANPSSVYSNYYEVGTGWLGAYPVEVGAGYIDAPQVSFDAQGNALAVWSQNDGTVSSIYSNQYIAGVGWQTESPVESDIDIAIFPQIVINADGNALAVWYQNNAIHSTSYTAGEGWESTKTQNLGAGSAAPEVSIDNQGNAIAVWKYFEAGVSNIYANRYIEGTGWQTAKLLETGTESATVPQVDFDSQGNALVVWAQKDGDINSIYSNRYIVDVGWQTAELIETSVGVASRPQISFDSKGNALAVWDQFDGTTYSVYSNRYIVDKGWQTAQLVEQNEESATSAKVTLDDNGNAMVVWRQRVNGIHKTFAKYLNLTTVTEQFTYNALNNVTQRIEAAGLSEQRATQYVYDKSGNLIETIQLAKLTDVKQTQAQIISNLNLGAEQEQQIAFDELGNGLAVWSQYDSATGFRHVYSNQYIAGSDWQTAEVLATNSSTKLMSPQITFDAQGNSLVLWIQSDGINSAVYTNRFVAGSGPGAGWQTAGFINVATGAVTETHIEFDNQGNALAVWSQELSETETFRDIYSNRYIAGTGADTGWQTAGPIGNRTGSAVAPQIGFDAQGNALAVWSQYDAGTYSIYSNQYLNGDGWQIAERVELNSGSASRPEITLDGQGNALAVWIEREATSGINSVYSNQYIAGEGWKTAELIETSDGVVSSVKPEIAFDEQGNALALWVQNDGLTNSLYSNRYVAGEGWQSAELIESSDETVIPFYSPQIVMDAQGNAMAAWSQWDGQNYFINFNRYTDGAGWQTAQLLETGSDKAPGVDPKLAINGDGNVQIVWSKYDGEKYRLNAKELSMQFIRTINAYDAHDNLIRTTDANDLVTYYYYDEKNRQIATVDAERNLHTFTYDAAGNRLTERTYADKIPVLDLTGNSFDLSVKPEFYQMPEFNVAEYREARYEYNVNNNIIEQSTREVLVYSIDSSTGTKVVTQDNSQSLVVTNTYNLANNISVITDARGAKTYNYYDRVGNKTLQVDSSGYVIAWDYDSKGNVLSETKYASKLNPDTRLMLEASQVPGYIQSLRDEVIIGEFNSDDRITIYTYDNMNRLLSTTVSEISYANINTSTGAPTEMAGDLATQYSYDAMGNRLSVTDANGSRTDYTYDNFSRIERVENPEFTDYRNRQVRTTRDSVYDALGNVLAVITRGDDYLPDQVQEYAYDSQGNFIKEVDAEGSITTYSYDLNNNVLSKQSTLTDADGISRLINTNYAYDYINRRISTESAPGYIQHVNYNAYGEITEKGLNGVDREFFVYDDAGRLIKTNKDDGVWRAYLYDANNNETVKIQSAAKNLDGSDASVTGGIDLSPDSMTTEEIANIAADRAQRTESEYDSKNQLIKTYQSEIKTTSTTVSDVPDAVWVNAVDDPFIGGESFAHNGGVWSYTLMNTSGTFDPGEYVNISELTLTWSKITGLGDSDIIIELDVKKYHDNTPTGIVGVTTIRKGPNATYHYYQEENYDGNNTPKYDDNKLVIVTGIRIYKESGVDNILIAEKNNINLVNNVKDIANKPKVTADFDSKLHFVGQVREAETLELSLSPKNGVSMAEGFSPEIKFDSVGNGMALWSQIENDQNKIYSRRFIKGEGWGQGWQQGWQPYEMFDTNMPDRAYHPELAIDDSGNAFAMWHQSDGVSVKVFSNYYEVGKGWQGIELVSNGIGANYASMGFDPQGNIIAVWNQSDATVTSIYANKFIPGSGWQTESTVNVLDTFTREPEFAIDNQGNAFAIWAQRDPVTSEQNMYASRYVAGEGWQAIPDLIESFSGKASFPQISVDSSGNAFAVWRQSNGPGDDSINSNRYIVGEGWKTNEWLETSAERAALSYPQISVDSQGNAVAVWEQIHNTYRSVYANRYIAGAGWQGAELLENELGTGSAGKLDVAIQDNGNIFVVWAQDTLDVGSPYSIFSTQYTAASGWQQQLDLLEGLIGHAYSPKIDIDSEGNILVIWEQQDGGNKIYSSYFTQLDGWHPAKELTNLSFAVKKIHNSSGVETNGWFDFNTSKLSFGDYDYEYRTTDRDGNVLEHVKGDLTLGANPSVNTKLVSVLQSEYTPGAVVANSISRAQTFNAFGEIDSEIDSRGNELLISNSEWAKSERIRQLTLAGYSSDPQAVNAAVNYELVENLGDSEREILLKAYTTSFKYNKRGQLLEKQAPETYATQSNGLSTRVSPVERYYYDELGRVIGERKANTDYTELNKVYNYNTQSYDAAGNVLKDFQGGFISAQNIINTDDLGVKNYKYDVFGNQSEVLNEKNERTKYYYNNNNQIKRISRGTSASFYRVDSEGKPYLDNVGNKTQNYATRYDEYTYDEAGNRTSHTNSLGLTERTYFDDLNRVIKTTTFGDVITDYSYDYDAITGGVNVTTTQENSKTLIDINNYFGRLEKHTDLGGREYEYIYNMAGWLTQQNGNTDLITAGNEQLIDFSYYHNGLLMEKDDKGVDTKTRYEYDSNGNRTVEAYYQQGGLYYQWAKVQYDELNRAVHIDDTKFSIDYEYDAADNRRHVYARYHDGLDGSIQRQDFWYTYDAKNRFTITKGSLSGTQYDATGEPIWDESGSGKITAGNNGYEIKYFDDNTRETSTYTQEVKPNEFVTKQERYVYTKDGLLTQVYINEDVNDSLVSLELRATRFYDAVGNVIEYVENVPGISSRTVKTRYFSDTHEYFDGKAHYETSLTETIKATGKDVLTNNSTYTYNNDGSMQKHYSWSQNRTVDPDDSETPTEVTTRYTYEYWDSAKQTQIRNDAKNADVEGTWAPGFSKFSYDVNGHLTKVSDEGGNRFLRYKNDSDGRIIQRNEIDGSANSRTQNYYYLNGLGIGDAGSFSPKSSLQDYTSLLASRTDTDDNARAGRVSSADFDYNFSPINDRYPATTPGMFTASQSEMTLQSVAIAVWGDGSLWYLIADANGMNSETRLALGETVVIPNVVTNIHNNSTTFKVYNPGELIGNTSPTLPEPPPPPKAECWKIVLVVVVVAVVSYYVGAWAGEYVGTVLGAAVGAGVGDYAGQLVSKELGLIDEIDKGSIREAFKIGGLTSLIPGFKNPSYLEAFANAAGRTIVTEAIKTKVLDDYEFDWHNVAAAAITSPVSRYFNKNVIGPVSGSGGFNEFAANFASGIATNAIQGIASYQFHHDDSKYRPTIGSIYGAAIGKGLNSVIDVPEPKSIGLLDFFRDKLNEYVNPKLDWTGSAKPTVIRTDYPLKSIDLLALEEDFEADIASYTREDESSGVAPPTQDNVSNVAFAASAASAVGSSAVLTDPDAIKSINDSQSTDSNAVSVVGETQDAISSTGVKSKVFAFIDDQIEYPGIFGNGITGESDLLNDFAKANDLSLNTRWGKRNHLTRMSVAEIHLKQQTRELGITKENATASALMLVGDDNSVEALQAELLNQFGNRFTGEFNNNEKLQQLVTTRLSDAQPGELINVTDIWGAALSLDLAVANERAVAAASFSAGVTGGLAIPNVNFHLMLDQENSPLLRDHATSDIIESGLIELGVLALAGAIKPLSQFAMTGRISKGTPGKTTLQASEILAAREARNAEKALRKQRGLQRAENAKQNSTRTGPLPTETFTNNGVQFAKIDALNGSFRKAPVTNAKVKDIELGESAKLSQDERKIMRESLRQNGRFNDEVIVVAENGSGQLFSVVGSNRLSILKTEGVQNIKIAKVELPFRGFITEQDLNPFQ